MTDERTSFELRSGDLVETIRRKPRVTMDDGLACIELHDRVLYRRLHEPSAPLHAATVTATHSQGDAS